MTAAPGTRIYLEHMRQAGLCGPGLFFWSRRYGAPLMRRFIAEGLPVDELAAMDDAYAQRLVTLVRQQEAAGG